MWKGLRCHKPPKSFQTDDKSESQRYFKENRACSELQAKVEALVALMLLSAKSPLNQRTLVRLNRGLFSC